MKADAPDIDPASLKATCPRCGAELWDRRDGQWTLLNAILKLLPSGVAARCPTRGCGTDVALPFLALVQPPEDPPDVPLVRIGVRRRVVAG